MNNNELIITDDNNQNIKVTVIDIIESDEFKKSFIIYYMNDNKNYIYASILNEKESSYSFDEITSQEELDYVNKIIDSFTSEEEVSI